MEEENDPTSSPRPPSAAIYICIDIDVDTYIEIDIAHVDGRGE